MTDTLHPAVLLAAEALAPECIQDQRALTAKERDVVAQLARQVATQLAKPVHQ